MKKKMFILLFIFTAFLVYSNENIIHERSSFLLRLNVDEESYWEWTVPQTPYVFNETSIQFYPGETLYVEAELVDDIIVKLNVVKENVNIDRTIILEFYQVTNAENERIHNYMMLVITNPFDRNLEYVINIHLVLQNRWVVARTFPVRANLMSYQSFPDIISAVVFHNFVLR